jgi:hypothetical protein
MDQDERLWGGLRFDTFYGSSRSVVSRSITCSDGLCLDQRTLRRSSLRGAKEGTPDLKGLISQLACLMHEGD